MCCRLISAAIAEELQLMSKEFCPKWPFSLSNMLVLGRKRWVLPMLWVRRPAHSAHCKQASKPQTQSIGASGGEWQWRRQSATNIHATLRASASCATLLNWRAPLTRSRDSENSNSNATQWFALGIELPFEII